jgi:PleD family two-component response regulator
MAAALVPDLMFSPHIAQALGIPHARNSSEAHQVIVSIGVAMQQVEAPMEVEALIGAVDRALYLAKGGGRNRVAALLPA